MSHNLEMINGRASMIFAGELPWHRLGTPLQRNVSWDVAFAACGADFHVSKTALQTVTGLAIRGTVALTRDDTGAVLNTVSDRYSIIQNLSAFRLANDAFGDHAVVHTAGVLKGGAEVWLLAELPPMAVLKDEIHRRFLLVTTGHGTRKACKVIPTATRVVCNNTLSFALSNSGDTADGITIRHSGDTDAKLADAGDALSDTYRAFSDYAKTAEVLAGKALTVSDRTELLTTLFGENKDAISRVALLSQYGKGQAGNTAIVGSAYALLQGVTDYVDHETRASRSRDINRAFAVSTMGAGAKLKAKALATLVAA